MGVRAPELPGVDAFACAVFKERFVMKVNWEFDLPKDSIDYQRALRGLEHERERDRLRRGAMSISKLMAKCLENDKSLKETAARVDWFIDAFFFHKEHEEDVYNQALNRDMEE